jgi:hypothetical protein
MWTDHGQAAVGKIVEERAQKREAAAREERQMAFDATQAAGSARQVGEQAINDRDGDNRQKRVEDASKSTERANDRQERSKTIAQDMSEYN